MKEKMKKLAVIWMTAVLCTGNVLAEEPFDTTMEYGEETEIRMEESVEEFEQEEAGSQIEEIVVEFEEETEFADSDALKETEYQEEMSEEILEEEMSVAALAEEEYITEEKASEATTASRTSAQDIKKVYTATGKNLSKSAAKYTPTVASINGEWQILGLARSGKLDEEVSQKYLENVIYTLQEKNGVLHEKKYSEYSRVVLALTSMGVDVTDVAGYDLLQPLADYDKTVWQGINGAIWALIAFDSHGYAIPQVEAGKTQNSRQKLIENILSQEMSGGGWDMSGQSADPDVTAMAIQALAPYYSTDEDVKNAVDRGIAKLSSMQKKNGSYATYGTETSESCSQVIVALTALGIDPNTDKRFVKNGTSVVDALMTYANTDGSFLHVLTGKADQMATEQAYYAMTAYMRFLNGKNSLYDMSDVELQSDQEKKPQKESETEKETGSGSERELESGNKNNASKKETGGSTKQVNLVSQRTNTTVAGKTDSGSQSEQKKESERESEEKEEETSRETGTAETEKEVADLISEINSLFRKSKTEKRLPENASDYTDQQKFQILEIYRAYLNLSEEQKKKVENSGHYQDYCKEIENLKEYHHFDESTGTDLRDNEEEVLPWYVQVEVSALTVDLDRAEKVKEALKGQGELLSDMNISLTDMLSHTQWEPQDLIRVSIPLIDLGEYEHVAMVHVKEDGTMEFLTAHIAGKNLEFDTDHFSSFGVVGYHGSMEELMTQKDENPIWMYLLPGAGAALLLTVLLIIRMAGKRKGRKNNER